MATPSTTPPMPKARSENSPLSQYIMAKPNKVPKATGNNNRGMVSQRRKQYSRNSSTKTSAPAIVVVRSCLICVEL